MFKYINYLHVKCELNRSGADTLEVMVLYLSS